MAFSDQLNFVIKGMSVFLAIDICRKLSSASGMTFLEALREEKGLSVTMLSTLAKPNASSCCVSWC
jgi:hypothetical protein